MKTKQKAKSWFKMLFAYGESQLSMLFDTRSDLCDNLETNGIFTKRTSLNSEEEILRVRYYKSQYFDKCKKDIYKQNIKATGLRGIALWKPVWEYLISQIPNAYTFSGKSLFVQSKQEFIHHNRDEKVCFDYYLGGKVSASTKFLEELRNGEKNKDKQVKTLKKLVVLSLILSIVPILSSVFFNEITGIIISSMILICLAVFFYFRNRNFDKFFFLPRRKIFEELFPNKKLLTDEIGLYCASGKPLAMIEIDFFSDEQVGVLYHQKLLKDGLNPSYVQLTCYTSLFTKKDNKFYRIIGKEQQNINPILFFEENEIVIIPFDEIENHPIMEYLIKNIKISDLDIPKIISKYVYNKLKIDH